MADKNISPEERLFKVIQEGKKIEDDSGEITSATPKKKEKAAAGRSNIKRFFSRSFAKKPKSEDPKLFTAPKHSSVKTIEVNVQMINVVIALVIVLFSVVIVLTFIMKKPGLAQITQSISRIKYQPLHEKTIESLKPFSAYLERIKKRDIFSAVPRIQEKQPEVQPKKEGPKILLEDLAKNLKLVGISWGKSPKVMIQDTKDNVTFFLTLGQAIGTTGIKIKNIHKDKVVISYEDQEMELG